MYKQLYCVIWDCIYITGTYSIRCAHTTNPNNPIYIIVYARISSISAYIVSSFNIFTIRTSASPLVTL